MGNIRPPPHRHRGRRDGGSNFKQSTLLPARLLQPPVAACSRPRRDPISPYGPSVFFPPQSCPAPPMGNLEEAGLVMFGWLGQAVRQGEGDEGRVPPGCVRPLPRQVCSGGPYRQTGRKTDSRHMPNPSHQLLPLVSMGRGVTGPGIDVVEVVVSTHPREEDQENEGKKKERRHLPPPQRTPKNNWP